MHENMLRAKNEVLAECNVGRVGILTKYLWRNRERARKTRDPILILSSPAFLSRYQLRQKYLVKIKFYLTEAVKHFLARLKGQQC